MLDKARSALLAAYLGIERQLAPDEIERRREGFLTNYSPEQLSRLSGDDLMRLVHGRDPRSGLFYDLEFADLYAPFGSIGGGSALKFKVYKAADGSGYRKKGQGNVPVPCSDEEAERMTADIAALLCKALRQSRSYRLADGDPALWRDFEKEVTSELPPSLAQTGHDSPVALLGWAHKYLAICEPDLFSFHHQTRQLANHFVRLGEVPDASGSRYLLDLQWRQLRSGDGELKECHPVLLMKAAYETFGAETKFWRLGTDEHSEQGLVNRWTPMEAGGFASIGWPSLGNLKEFLSGLEGVRARERISQVLSTDEEYAGATAPIIRRWASQIHDFYAGMSVGDRIVAMKGQQLLGVGEIAGDYEFDPDDIQPHHRRVRWHNVPSEAWHGAPGLRTTLYNFTSRHAEAVRAERLLLSSDVLTPSLQRYTPYVETEKRVAGMDYTGSGLLLRETPAPATELEVQVSPTISVDLPDPAPLPPLEQRIKDILCHKGQVILYGPPGTGKTYQARQTARELVSREMCGGRAWAMLDAKDRRAVDDTIELITFHPAYAYEDFVEGYRPVPAGDGVAGFELRDGMFLEICERARRSPERHRILIIDEINRGNVAAVMGELITLLESDKRESLAAILPLSRRSFRIPKNLWIVGTMNTADRSIALLDAALRRRFGFVEVLPEPERIAVDIDGLSLPALLTEINARIRKHVTHNARELQVGHAYFMRAGQPLHTKQDLLATFRDDILPLLAEYCFENYATLARILGDEIINVAGQVPNAITLSSASSLHKALRRLVSADPPRRSELEDTVEHNSEVEPESIAARNEVADDPGGADETDGDG